MDVLLKKIRAIHVTNTEIIDRVERLQEVVLYDYSISTNSSGMMELRESVEKKSGALTLPFERLRV